MKFSKKYLDSHHWDNEVCNGLDYLYINGKIYYDSTPRAHYIYTSEWIEVNEKMRLKAIENVLKGKPWYYEINTP